ncbi:crosslink repair DNA glycosylase YcaQ family protein, partial [Micromonospora purpureochromogenes]|uniref:DNA glycosylase AlkZ-like family protein n=1 Tax=Micromonospora purpureochromogenes TaxID=47872 RepID=UPI003317B214
RLRPGAAGRPAGPAHAGGGHGGPGAGVSPPALLVDGEIMGTWRARQSGRARLDLTVTPFTRLSARAGERIEAEAETVRLARGASAVTVRVESG